jgi:hypothetical protein
MTAAAASPPAAPTVSTPQLPDPADRIGGAGHPVAVAAAASPPASTKHRLTVAPTHAARMPPSSVPPTHADMRAQQNPAPQTVSHSRPPGRGSVPERSSDGWDGSTTSKNGGWAKRKLAPTAAACRAIESSDLAKSVMCGSSGEFKIPTVNAASLSLCTAANRRSGRDARDSSSRASAASGVVIVKCSNRVFRRAISCSLSTFRQGLVITPVDAKSVFLHTHRSV